MSNNDPWPTVSLYAYDDEVRSALGTALEQHGYVTLISLCDILLAPSYLARLVIRLMPHLSQFLGECPINWDGGWELRKHLDCPQVNLFTFFTRSYESVVVKAGDIMEFWSRGRIRRVPDLPVPDARETYYVRPGPDTMLRIIPRMTVGQYLQQALTSVQSSQKESS